MPSMADKAMGAAAHRQAAFQALRPVCSALLQHRMDAADLASKLAALQKILEQTETVGLSQCWDYVLFPLMLVVDSVAGTRMAPAAAAAGSAGGAAQAGMAAAAAEEVPVPAAKADRVAEAALGE